MVTPLILVYGLPCKNPAHVSQNPFQPDADFKPTDSGEERKMSITITLEDAQAKLTELVHQLVLGDEIIITENQQTIARLRSEIEQPVRRPLPGLGKESVLYMAPDFDEPLDEMKEYMG